MTAVQLDALSTSDVKLRLAQLTNSSHSLVFVSRLGMGGAFLLCGRVSFSSWGFLLSLQIKSGLALVAPLKNQGHSSAIHCRLSLSFTLKLGVLTVAQKKSELALVSSLKSQGRSVYRLCRHSL